MEGKGVRFGSVGLRLRIDAEVYCHSNRNRISSSWNLAGNLMQCMGTDARMPDACSWLRPVRNFHMFQDP